MCWATESIGRVMPGMESIVATMLLEEVVGAHGLAGVKSIDIWLTAMLRIKPRLTCAWKINCISGNPHRHSGRTDDVCISYIQRQQPCSYRAKNQ